MKPILLDLFCGAGGCAKGYQDAGYYVVGVDIEPQPRYVGDEFVQGDAIEKLTRLISGERIVTNKDAYHLENFAAIHASPPCQGYSQTKGMTTKKHPMLIADTRNLLSATAKPYIIENV